MQRASSVRPAPTNPAKPTTSPARTANPTSSSTPSRRNPRTSSRTGPSVSRAWTKRCDRSRPTIIRTSRSWVASATGNVPTSFPSRSTVTRCAIAKTSSSRCEM